MNINVIQKNNARPCEVCFRAPSLAKRSIMKNTMKSSDFTTLYPAEKKFELFHRQKDLLDTFLATGAISRRSMTKALIA